MELWNYEIMELWNYHPQSEITLCIPLSHAPLSTLTLTTTDHDIIRWILITLWNLRDQLIEHEPQRSLPFVTVLKSSALGTRKMLVMPYLWKHLSEVTVVWLKVDGGWWDEWSNMVDGDDDVDEMFELWRLEWWWIVSADWIFVSNYSGISSARQALPNSRTFLVGFLSF
jgi:hypothetical protein